VETSGIRGALLSWIGVMKANPDHRSRDFGMELLGYASLVPLTIVVHVTGHYLPPWLLGCNPRLYLASEPPIGIEPLVLWKPCAHWINVLGWAGGPLATLCMALLGPAIQSRLPRTGMILATTGLFFLGTLLCSVAFGSPRQMDGYVLGQRLGIPGWTLLLGFPATGVAVFGWSLCRCRDRVRAVLGMSIGCPLGLAAWVLAGFLVAPR
jgi:hypothetical protein